MLAGFLLFLCCRSVSLPISLCFLSFNNCIRSRLVFIYLCWVSPACLFCTCGLQESFQFLRSWRDFSLSLVLQKLFKRLCLGLKDRRIFRCIIQIFLPFLSWSSVQINYGGKKKKSSCDLFVNDDFLTGFGARQRWVMSVYFCWLFKSCCGSILMLTRCFR